LSKWPPDLRIREMPKTIGDANAQANVMSFS